MSWTEYEMKVLRWAEDRRIIPNSTPLAQAIKTHEELGESVPTDLALTHPAASGEG